MSIIEINLCPCDFIDEKFLFFDYDYFKNQIGSKNKIPNYIADTKLLMWLYYINNPNTLPSRFYENKNVCDTYLKNLQVLFTNDYSFYSFDAEQYLNLYPDVSKYCKKSPVKAFCHFLYFGLSEGRQITFKNEAKKNSKELIPLEVIIKDCLEKYKINQQVQNEFIDVLKNYIQTLLIKSQLSLQFYLIFKFIDDIFSIINFGVFVNRLKSTKNVTDLISSLKIKLGQKSGEIKFMAERICYDFNFFKTQPCNKDTCYYCQLVTINNRWSQIDSAEESISMEMIENETTMEIEIEPQIINQPLNIIHINEKNNM